MENELEPRKYAEWRIAFAQGHEVEWQGARGEWFDVTDVHDWSCGGVNYRIKPPCIRINGKPVPEPLRDEPDQGDTVFLVTVDTPDFFTLETWTGDRLQLTRLKRGLYQETSDRAVEQAKAMLNFGGFKNED